MKYKIETTSGFDKDFKKLDKYTQKMIYAWIGRNMQDCEGQRTHGRPLTADSKNQWHYRIGGYRLICHIEGEKLVRLALTVGHCRNIYLL